MPERNAMVLGASANPIETMNDVADRTRGGVPPPARGRWPLGSLDSPANAIWGQSNGGGEQSRPVSGFPADTGREHDGPRNPLNIGNISTSTAERSTRQRTPDAERVLIIDDCTLFRESLAANLAGKGIDVAGEAWDLPSLLVAVQEVDASLILLNTATWGSHLLLRAAMESAPGVRVIVFGTSEEDESEIIACAEAGVDGYHMRRDSLDDLVALIRNVAAGKPFCPARVSAVLLRRLSNLASQPQPAGRDMPLTARETQILKMLELGRSNRDIAARLNIAVHTVKNHVHNLLTKLGVSTRAEAAALSRARRSARDARRN